MRWLKDYEQGKGRIGDYGVRVSKRPENVQIHIFHIPTKKELKTKDLDSQLDIRLYVEGFIAGYEMEKD